MVDVSGFPPVIGSRPRVLILGSMPGVASLERQQYYGLPRNAFWRIMGELFGAGPDLPYEQRLRKLVDQHVALWDVLARCFRPGSLDAAIVSETAEPNDFHWLLKTHSSITDIFFNGQSAEKFFNRHVKPGLADMFDSRCHAALPSTSPAHASRSFAQKLEAWRIVRDVAGQVARGHRR